MIYALILTVLCIGYGAGILTGYLLFDPRHRL